VSDREIAAIAAAIGRELRKNRAAIMQEPRIHDGIAVALGDLGIECEREFRLDERSRLDFWLPEEGFAVEVKKGTAKLPCLRQVGRYLEHSRVKGCIIVAMRCQKLPDQFRGKPLAKIELWRELL
jgi:signal recognition particle subunit SEC65